jgi:hypothetical protein
VPRQYLWPKEFMRKVAFGSARVGAWTLKIEKKFYQIQT